MQLSWWPSTEAWFKSGQRNERGRAGLLSMAVLKQNRLYYPILPNMFPSLWLCVPFLLMPSWKTGQPSLFTSENSDCLWDEKVAITLSGFPTQLSKRQTLSSTALSAPLCIKAALYVTELLKLHTAMLCQTLSCWNWVSKDCLSGRRAFLVFPQTGATCKDTFSASP